MEYTEIQKLIDSMGESKLTDLDIEFADGTKISMKKNNASVTSVAPSVEALATVVSSVSIEEKREVTNQNVKIVKAPMVGTFYSKANPTSNPFVLEGDKIEKGQTLCIVEAMKLMNEIESEFSGKVLEVLVKDGDTVEYGTSLFRIG